jgi:hypothetical protein
MPGLDGRRLAAEPVPRAVVVRVKVEQPGSRQPVDQLGDLLIRARCPQAVQQLDRAAHPAQIVQAA